MSNIGYREILDFGALSLKQLNDNLRAIWAKVMGDIEYRDLSRDTQAVINAKVDAEALDAYTTIEQTGEWIALEVGAVDGRVTQLQATADGLSSRVTRTEGDVSELSQAADGLSSRVTRAEGDVSELSQAADGLLSRVAKAEGDVSELSQAADGLLSRVTKAEGDVSELSQAADGLLSRVANAEGDVSALTQTADGLLSRVANAEGGVNALTQTANGLSSTVSNLTGRVSAIEQTDSSVAVELRDPSVDSTLRVQIGADTIPIQGSMNGLSIRKNGAFAGGMYPFVDGIMVASGTRIGFLCEGGYMWIGRHESSGSAGLICDLNILPRMGNACNLGGDGSNQRWSRLYTNNAVNVSSDLRLKRDVEPVNALGLLEALRPIRYRVIADPEKLHFGLGAQDVQAALQGTDCQDAAVLGDENPDSLGLCYEELIAVLIEGWQRHEATIGALEARAACLEGRA